MSANNQSLMRWLDTATDGLSAGAKERIKLEIESHFQEAVEAYRADDQTEEQAHALALEDLGDAKVEARRFRKTHLTEEEAERLAEMWASYLKKRGPRSNVFLTCFAYLIFFHVICGGERRLPFVCSAVAVVTMIALEIAEYVIIRRGSLFALRRLTPMDLMGWFCLFIVIALCQDWSFAFCLLLFAFLTTGRKVPFWLKLRRMDDFSREMPPPGATAS